MSWPNLVNSALFFNNSRSHFLNSGSGSLSRQAYVLVAELASRIIFNPIMLLVVGVLMLAFPFLLRGNKAFPPLKFRQVGHVILGVTS